MYSVTFKAVHELGPFSPLVFTIEVDQRTKVATTINSFLRRVDPAQWVIEVTYKEA